MFIFFVEISKFDWYIIKNINGLLNWNTHYKIDTELSVGAILFIPAVVSCWTLPSKDAFKCVIVAEVSGDSELNTVDNYNNSHELGVKKIRL